MKPKLVARFVSLYAFFFLCLGISTTANAAETSGGMFDEAVVIGGEALQLQGGALSEGVGVSKKAKHRVALALYLAQRKTTPNDVIKAAGAKRIAMKMQQDVESEQLSRSFLNGIRNNVERAERTKIASQLLKFGELFGSIPEFQKGDVINVDWVPTASSTVLTLNGKKIGDFPDRAFYDAFLLCFLGERPIDPKLKNTFLGEKRE